MSSRSRHSRRTLPTQRSMWAFAFGARTGVRMTLTPSFARRVSNARGNLASRSWIRKRTCRLPSLRSISRLRACCSIQAVFGLLVQARYSTRRLPTERKTRTYKRCSQVVSTVKKSQARIDSPWARRKLRHDCEWPRRRRQPSLDQDVADRAWRNGDTELAQLAHDPLIAPARVLAREAHDELAYLGTDRRPARRRCG